MPSPVFEISNRTRLLTAIVAALAIDARRPSYSANTRSAGPRGGRKSKRPHFHPKHKFSRRHLSMR